MQKLIDHIERVREKPHEERRQIAFTLAGGIAAFVGLAWFGVQLATGAFYVDGASFADTTAPVEVQDSSRGLAGAAAALPADTEGPARIQILDTEASSTLTEERPTVIPF